jgi:hypothetical protein
VRVFLGWFTFILATAFATGLVATLILNAWFAFPTDRALLGFFGFGLPMFAAGGATAALWDGRKALQTFLGWAGTTTAIVCGVAVLFLVGQRVFSEAPPTTVGVLIWHVLGFAVSASFCGGFGISMLFEAEGKSD